MDENVPNFSEIDGIITTLNHSNVVKDYFNNSKKPIYTIGSRISPKDLMNIAKLKEGTKVAFICLGNKGGESLANRVDEAGIKHISSITGGIPEKDHLNKMINTVDYIYISEAACQELTNLVPEKASILPLELDNTSEQILKDLK
ncbi:hypothetical protein [Mesobacillus zeae]|uniref:Uncharacterized protein n=1 Tax=Mesobacillus zeae TaxID=1917180 RepID=A0A398B591_9BACI|nr:hypothetical protein [Mesobacillus zeae]RID83120.1 hypothetical protein D1970_16495 [Mesobacillus zeae]